MNTILNLKREARFLAKQSSFWIPIGILFLLATMTVWNGIALVHSQTILIEQLIDKDKVDRNEALVKQTDYGSAAYYSFYFTYSSPTPLGFVTLGQRAIYPWKHRIRMLALEGQIYESDTDNPELAFIGKFDFAFLVSVVLPLFVIVMLHDIQAREAKAGRFDLLQVSMHSTHTVWLGRSTVVILGIASAVVLPFVTGALVTQAPVLHAVIVILIILFHILFWGFVTVKVGAIKPLISQGSARIAALLLGIWVCLTLVVPALGNTLIQRSVSGPSGGDIMLTQREAVNDAWDLPFDATWGPFLNTHPQWQEYTEMSSLFEWKWYYAFQQVGDQKAAKLSNAYRQSLVKKDKYGGYVALLSPSLLTQRLLEKVSETDTKAMLAYEDCVRHFHTRLRTFFYPLLFESPEYSTASYDNLPLFSHTQCTHLGSK